MSTRVSRRGAMQLAGAAALAPSISRAASARRSWPVEEGPDTPKICLNSGDGAMPPPMGEQAGGQAGQAAGGRGMGGANQEASWRRIRQLGVNYIIGIGLGSHPWEAEKIRAVMERVRQAGLNFYGTLISFSNNITYGRPGRDADIELLIKSIQAAGQAGLPLVEYNFYANRVMEGYFEELGRAGIGHTGFDYERPVEEGGKTVLVKDLPPRPEVGAWKAEDMWKNLTYVLKAIVPVAEKAGVRLALHPNDPPAPLSRGSEQIMGTLAGWRRLITIVDSPANGITFDCGVTREMGEDPVEVCRYFASRDRINHVHFRNVIVMKPYERYKEVSIDEGQVDMFGVMLELVRNKYNRTIFPEHPRALDYDRERPGFRPQYPGGGGYAGYAFTVAYTRAMMQAALASV